MAGRKRAPAPPPPTSGRRKGRPGLTSLLQAVGAAAAVWLVGSTMPKWFPVPDDSLPAVVVALVAGVALAVVLTPARPALVIGTIGGIAVGVLMIGNPGAQRVTGGLMTETRAVIGGEDKPVCKRGTELRTTVSGYSCAKIATPRKPARKPVKPGGSR